MPASAVKVGEKEHLQGAFKNTSDNLVTPIQRDIASSNKDIKILFGELSSHSYPANLEGSDDNFSRWTIFPTTPT